MVDGIPPEAMSPSPPPDPEDKPGDGGTESDAPATVIEASRAAATDVRTDAKEPGDAVVEGADESAVEAEIISSSAVDAEVIDAAIATAPVRDAPAPPMRSPFDPNHGNQGAISRLRDRVEINQTSPAAKGGAVGAVVLGAMAIPGALLTFASAFTAVLGILLGLWGLMSDHKRMAIIGIVLSVVAFMISAFRGPLGLTDWF